MSEVDIKNNLKEIIENNIPADNSSTKIDSMKEMMREAFEEFNQKSVALSKAYSGLKAEIARINSELEQKNRELSEKNEILDRNKEFLNNLFQGMTNGILVIDSNNKIIKLNNAFVTLIKKQEHELLGNNLYDLKYLDPLVRFLEHSKKSGGKRYFSACKLNIEDENLWLELSGVFIGDGLEYLFVIKDLTEVKDLRNQLTNNAALADLGQMAVTVAHEIRNPLGGIEGFARLMQRDLKGDSKNSKNIEKIISGVSSLNNFIGGLLTFSKPININIQKSNLLVVVNKAIQYSGKGEDFDAYPNIKIIRIINGIKQIKTDPELLQQVILNLLLNAYQIIEENEGTVEITIKEFKNCLNLESNSLKNIKSLSYDNNRRHIMISVKDSGPGLDKSIIEQIFTPFFTTKSFGTGIGLSMVLKIIEVLECRMDIYEKSSLGGAEFRIYIPELLS